MAEVTFRKDTDIFKKRDYLKDTHNPPDEIVGRDEEVEGLVHALTPIVNNEIPDNVFIYGPTGVGKTAVTSHVVHELKRQIESEDDQFDIDLTVININCESHNGGYSVAIEIVNTLRDPDNKISESGYSQSEVYNKLFPELDRVGGSILIVLDELHSLDPDKMNTLMYEISRAHANERINKDTKLGLIGISSNPTILSKLRTDVQSSLYDKEIQFESYTATELEELLDHRAEQSFYEDALSDGVTSLCASEAAKEGGDARRAIQVLREAGDLAREQNETAVTVEHVQKATEKIQADELLTSIRNLSVSEKILAYALVTLEAETGLDEAPPRTPAVYKRYKKLSERAGQSAVTKRQIRNYLSHFNTLDLVASRGNRGGEKGNFQTHTLNVEIEDVLTALDEALDACGVHNSIQALDVVQPYLKDGHGD